MIKLRKFAMVGLMAVVIGGTTITAFAASSGLDNNINDNSKMQEFVEKRFESKKSVINDRVESGELSREEADQIIERMEENIRYCNSNMQGRHRQDNENFGWGWRHNNNDENDYESHMNNKRGNMNYRMGNMMNRMRHGSGFRMNHHRNNH